LLTVFLVTCILVLDEANVAKLFNDPFQGSGVGPTFADDEDLGDDFSGEWSGSGHATTKLHLGKRKLI
jgi:hypothetical protein